MYEQSFGLKERPFSLTPDPRFLFLSANHRGALDHLLYGITRREGFLVITGDIGTGKTTICRALLERLDARVQTALILNPMLEEEQLLTAILEDFGIMPPPRATRKDLIDRLNLFLLEQAQEGGAVLIIDEAQGLPPPVLEQIRILSNLETDEEKLLQIILVGQRELREKLEHPALCQLNQRISIRYHLIPLRREEMVRYIDHRLLVAGARGGIEFSPGAYRTMYKFSKGVPRLINLIADRALLSGYVAGSTQITKKMVLEGRRSLTGEGVTTWASFRSVMRQHLKAPMLTLCLSFVFVALLGALLSWGAIGFEAWWSAIDGHLRVPLAASPHIDALGTRAPVAPSSVLSTFHGVSAFPYTIRAIPSRDGEGLRRIVRDLEEAGFEVFVGEGSGAEGTGQPVMVGRFKTPDDAQAALEKIQRLGGMERLEVIQSAPLLTRRKSK